MNTQNQIETTCDLLKSILKSKNADYGDSAFKSPMLCPDMPASKAIQVRMSDKLNRIIQLERLAELNQDQNVKTESLVDSYLDLAGYAILRVIELERQIKWDGKIDKPEITNVSNK